MDGTEPADLPFAGLASDINPDPSPLREAITAAYRIDEPTAVHSLLAHTARFPESEEAIRSLATRLIKEVRAQRVDASGVDALMHEFSLSSDEGIALMCLAEALLRIPDHATADRLIAEKIGNGDWRRHLGESPSLFVNAAAWGLMITGKLVSSNSERTLGTALTRLIGRGGEPLIRRGVELAMRMLGKQFVAGQTIEEALDHARSGMTKGYRFSFDMLGEAALTSVDAERYFAAYEHAVRTVGASAEGSTLIERPGISVKLSALHPRYSRAQRHRVMTELLPRLRHLMLLCNEYGIGLSIDAEEADRLEMSLDLIEQLALEPALRDFDGFGVVVQAYQKRAPFVIDFLADLARRRGCRFMLRLVKGAYWDTEIKRAQVEGAADYPVFTRKAHTDVSYLACAQKLLDASSFLFPQFATHNAQTLACIRIWARERGIRAYEFQCLHGMGETLYDQLIGSDGIPCRIYAPVGSHETLLAYLVRRLLENGANTSFVNRIVDKKVPIEELIANPLDLARETAGKPHPCVPLPANLFGESRRNSAGLDLGDEAILRMLYLNFSREIPQQWQAFPLLAVNTEVGETRSIVNPGQRFDVVGKVTDVLVTEINAVICAAVHSNWKHLSGRERAAILQRASDLVERHRLELLELAVREAGKNLSNAVGEVREAVDFLRYYALNVLDQANSKPLGVIACISPWNFPLSIFIGQISAALATGNSVLAKPAEQTPLIAFRVIQLLHEAGVPRDALQLLLGPGETVGAALVADKRVAGVVFTGSTEVARSIHRSLAKRTREGHEISLIAETGGQNAMIVDSSALSEQVVQDAITSAFDSAGQRCSALRVLCLQEDIADRVLNMLRGSLAECRVGRPDRLDTDIGPVIDRDAQAALLAHIEELKRVGCSVWQAPLTAETSDGFYVPPTIIEIESVGMMKQEVFGPVLHVVRYRREQLPELMNSINCLGFGLTMGVHSRIEETIQFAASRAKVGNLYVNRNMIGAMVGVQPFGGEGLSGTGPKAGGPLYLSRLQRENGGMPVPSRNSNPVLIKLLELAEGKIDSKSIEAAKQFLGSSLAGSELTLPGPVGESNSLTFFPRGKILCVAGHFEDIFVQSTAALSNFNSVCLLTSFRQNIPDWFDEALKGHISWSDEDELAIGELSMALADQDSLQRFAIKLASFDGPLIPVIRCDRVRHPRTSQLVLERTLTINTAAIGGNPGLLALEA